MPQEGIRAGRRTRASRARGIPRKRPPEGGLESIAASSGSERVLGAERVRGVARQAVAALHADVGVQTGPLAERVVVAEAELAAVVVGTVRVETIVRRLHVARADGREGA